MQILFCLTLPRLPQELWQLPKASLSCLERRTVVRLHVFCAAALLSLHPLMCTSRRKLALALTLQSIWARGCLRLADDSGRVLTGSGSVEKMGAGLQGRRRCGDPVVEVLPRYRKQGSVDLQTKPTGWRKQCDMPRGICMISGGFKLSS